MDTVMDLPDSVMWHCALLLVKEKTDRGRLKGPDSVNPYLREIVVQLTSLLCLKYMPFYQKHKTPL